MTAAARGIAYAVDTQRIRESISKLERAHVTSVGQLSDGQASRNFDLLLHAHREQLGKREIQFLTSLCFSFPATRDGLGMRYVLWRPVVLLLEQALPVEIEDWFCQGEVAIVYLTHRVGQLAEKICIPLEQARRNNPYHDPDSALQLTVNVLLEIGDTLSQSDPTMAEVVDEMRKRFIANVRNHHLSGNPLSMLSDIARVAPDWAVLACVEFLRKIQAENTNPQPVSLALASENSLAHDWLQPEEDAAWNYLKEVG